MVSVAAGAEEGRQISERLRGSQPAPRLPACDCLHVWTHPRGDASADHRLLCFLADKKTAARSFEALGEAVDVDSAVYCWRRSGVFWRMHHRPHAQAPTVLGPSLRPHWMQPRHLFSVFFAVSACVCSSSVEVTVTSSISHPSFVSHRGLFNTSHRSLGP